MRILIAIAISASSALLTLFVYVSRLYSEKGRFLIRGSKDNVEFFEEHVEAKLKIGEEEAEQTFPLLVRLTTTLIAILIMAWDFGQPVRWGTVAQGGLFMIFEVVFFAEVLPQALLARTAGTWLLPATGLLRAFILIVYPLVAISQFLHHIATLGIAGESDAGEPSAGENIEALMTAGEEEGLLEKDDRKLIRSVVEFGDKTVREVMTPRPDIFAVPAGTTLAKLKQILATERYSRIPVYAGDLDHMQGFVYARDILPLADTDLAHNTVSKILRPVSFVPETKSVSELLKELQQKAQIAIVIDEYGAVAGLVTVEDMVEEIVGEIRDEHEPQDVIAEANGAFSVPGYMDLDRLHELFGVRIEDAGEATTVSGLVTATMGKVPSPGETMERDGLVFQVAESNGRKIERLLVRAAEEHPTVAVKASSSASIANHKETA